MQVLVTILSEILRLFLPLFVDVIKDSKNVANDGPATATMRGRAVDKLRRLKDSSGASDKELDEAWSRRER